MEFEGKQIYHGDIHEGDSYRREYADSIARLLTRKHAQGYTTRESFLPPSQLKTHREEYRQEYLKMIGFPFDLMRKELPRVDTVFVGEDDFCKIYRLSLEVAEDFRFYGMLMLPNGITKAPLVIAQHGGGGTPEFCSDFHTANNYNFFTKRALQRGFAVFAPSLLLWSFGIKTGEDFPQFEIPIDRAVYDQRLRQVGYGITGLEVFCIMRSLDYLCAQEFVDEQRIGMMGLSYGGYFSLHTAAADERIISIYDAGSFNDRSEVCFSDWSYPNSAYLFHDAEVAALCAPRRLRIDVGKQDQVFDYRPSAAEAERIKKYYAAFNAEQEFQFNLWDGGHRFEQDCSGFDFFFDGLCR